MRLSEDVIRYLTVKQDGPMPPPRVLPSQAETTPVEATAAETEAD
jgi:small subunit ribosomal protein S6